MTIVEHLVSAVCFSMTEDISKIKKLKSTLILHPYPSKKSGNTIKLTYKEFHDRVRIVYVFDAMKDG